MRDQDGWVRLTGPSWRIRSTASRSRSPRWALTKRRPVVIGQCYTARVDPTQSAGTNRLTLIDRALGPGWCARWVHERLTGQSCARIIGRVVSWYRERPDGPEQA